MAMTSISQSMPKTEVEPIPSPIVIEKGFIVRLWNHLSKSRQRQFWLQIVLMIIASIAEVVSIGAIIPFLGALTSPERLFNLELAQPVIQYLNISTPDQLLAPITIAFISAAMFSAGIRLLVLWTNARFSFGAGADLGIKIFRNTLYQPYHVHISRNTSEIINGITAKSQALITGALSPLTSLLTGGLILISVLVALAIYQPEVAFAIFSSFGLIYWIIFRIARKRLFDNSARIAFEGTQRIKALQEGLGGIRDLLLDNTQETYCSIYRESDKKMRAAQALNLFISASPKLLMEAIGISLISVLAYILVTRPDSASDALPILGSLALGAQRLLPMMQQIYNGWANMKGNYKSVLDALDLLDQPVQQDPSYSSIAPVPFSKSILFSNVWFKYNPANNWTLIDLSFTIPKGSRVGVVGKTGSGKSTLIDILMGLLLPTEGAIHVDGAEITEKNIRGWQKHIAHVPQTIYLADASIAENIAFGVPKELIDHEGVVRAAAQAQISAFIDGLDLKYATKVGERGVFLSGGQRQRIGIARALYKNADVLIFDEATSALDHETEQSVVQAINNLDRNLTIFVIAHRLSTLESCDLLINIESNRVHLKTVSTDVRQ
jgi:ABC-type multidrug transport system fused ATPase/permease subunit